MSLISFWLSLEEMLCLVQMSVWLFTTSYTSVLNLLFEFLYHPAKKLLTNTGVENTSIVISLGMKSQ